MKVLFVVICLGFLLIACSKESNNVTAKTYKFPHNFSIVGERAQIIINGTSYTMDETNATSVLLNNNTTYPFKFTSINSSVPMVNDSFYVDANGQITFENEIIYVTTSGNNVVFKYVIK